jgi:Na+-driven multidrug efflux pump
VDTFIRTSAVVMTFSMIGFILVRFVFLDDLASLFASARLDDPREVEKAALLVRYIKEIYVYDCLSIPTLAVTSSVLGILYGYGKTHLSTILNFSRIATRIITLTALYYAGMNYTAVGIAMGISNIIIMALSVIFCAIFMIKEKPLKKQNASI